MYYLFYIFSVLKFRSLVDFHTIIASVVHLESVIVLRIFGPTYILKLSINFPMEFSFNIWNIETMYLRLFVLTFE